MTCKEGHFHVFELFVNKQFKAFSINLNAQYVNGITHCVRLLDILKVAVLTCIKGAKVFIGFFCLCLKCKCNDRS